MSIVVIVQSVIRSQTAYNITNGFTLQVHDGIEYGERCLHLYPQLSGIELTILIQVWPLRDSRLPFLETALFLSRLSCTG